jgi:hypothetical protein
MKEELDKNEDEALFEIVNKVAFADNPLTVLMAIAKASEQFNRHVIQDFESKLRLLGSPVYLLAAIPEKDFDFEPTMPHSKGKVYSYFLDIDVNGLESMQIQLTKRGMTTSDNYEALGDTGILSPKSGTETSRQAHALNYI